MSVAHSVPEGASPPPEPPPRDYTDMTLDFRELDRKAAHDIDGDVKIRARIEACRQGMMQLDALRSKHIRLMQEMRGRLPTIPGCADVQTRIKRNAAAIDRSSLQSVDSGVSSMEPNAPSTRCSSPSISHRSSLSCDSGCSSVYSQENRLVQAKWAKYVMYDNHAEIHGKPSPMSPLTSATILLAERGAYKSAKAHLSTNGNTRTMPYSIYRKLSIEQKDTPEQEPVDTAPGIPIVATTIASTTSLRSDRITRAWRRQQQRPRSMFDHSPEHQSPRRDSMIDTTSFMQITPPPVHRKMGVAGQPPRSPLVPIRVVANTSPPATRPLRTAQRPDNIKSAKVENADMLFRASRVFVDRSPPQDRRLCNDSKRSLRCDKRTRPKSMFEQADEPLYATPVRAMNRFSACIGIEQSRTGKSRAMEKIWYESEGL